jgi:hypothetical protein
MWPPRWDSSRSPAPSAAATSRRTTRSTSFMGSSPPRCSPPPHRFSHGYATPSPLGIGPAATAACLLRRRRDGSFARVDLLYNPRLFDLIFVVPQFRPWPRNPSSVSCISGYRRSIPAPPLPVLTAPRNSLPLPASLAPSYTRARGLVLMAAPSPGMAPADFGLLRRRCSPLATPLSLPAAPLH